MSPTAKSDVKHRSLRFWLAASAVVLIGMGLLIALADRTFTAWLVLAGAFANFMASLMMWRARSRAG